MLSKRKRNVSENVLNNKELQKMNILEDSINSAIIIDDKYDEVEALEKLLKSLGIYVEYHNYAGNFHVEGEGHLKNRNLIFMDLMLNDNSSQVRENISIFIDILSKLTNGKHFGLYGLVVWTKHDERIDDLKKALSQAALPIDESDSEETDEEEVTTCHLDNPPLFVVGLKKSAYNKGGGVFNYDTLKDDLEKQLADNKSAYFFVHWNATVEEAKSHIVHEFYKLGKDYTIRDQRLTYLLCELAKNHTGLKDANEYPYLTTDAYKAFDELLFSKLYVEQKDISTPLFDVNLDCPFEKVEERQSIAATLNAMFFIDDVSLSANDIVPGNIYRVKNTDSALVTNRKASIDLANAEFSRSNGIKEYNEKQRKKLPNNPQLKEEIEPFVPECWDVAIELTPPCDYSQNNRKMARLVGGYIFDIPLGMLQETSKKITNSRRWVLA